MKLTKTDIKWIKREIAERCRVDEGTIGLCDGFYDKSDDSYFIRCSIELPALEFSCISKFVINSFSEKEYRYLV